MNSMPAASKAANSAIKLARVVLGGPSPASARTIVLVLTEVLNASSRTDQRKAFRAMRICTPVNVDKEVI